MTDEIPINEKIVQVIDKGKRKIVLTISNYNPEDNTININSYEY